MTATQIMVFVLAGVAVAEAVALAVLWMRLTREREQARDQIEELRRRLDPRTMLMSGGREAVKTVWSAHRCATRWPTMQTWRSTRAATSN